MFLEMRRKEEKFPNTTGGRDVQGLLKLPATLREVTTESHRDLAVFSWNVYPGEAGESQQPYEDAENILKR